MSETHGLNPASPNVMRLLGGKTSTVAARVCGRARVRKCSPPFRGGLRPPQSEKRDGEKTPQTPARPPYPAGAGFYFLSFIMTSANP